MWCLRGYVLFMFGLQVVVLVFEGEVLVLLNLWIKLKKLVGIKLLFLKQGYKFLKRWLESGVVDGVDFFGYGKQIFMEGREDFFIDIDESFFFLKFWSKKKGVLEKLFMEKISVLVKLNSGFNFLYQEFVRKE